jgi:hypothetical protein
LYPANKWPVHSFDLAAAYLNSPIDEEVWVKLPEGLEVPAGYVLLLQRVLYGTRQVAQCCWLHLREVLNYTPSQYNRHHCFDWPRGRSKYETRISVCHRFSELSGGRDLTQNLLCGESSSQACSKIRRNPLEGSTVMFILCDKGLNLYFKSFFYIYIFSHHYLSHIFSSTQACTYFIPINSLLGSEIQFPLGGISYSHFTHIVLL